MRSSRYRARFANRILSKRFNNPRRRRFCFPETPQDRLCKTSRYARILVPCSRHFPLILSIVPSVRNSGKRSRIIPPATQSRKTSGNGTRDPRTGAEKSGRNTFDNFALSTDEIVFRKCAEFKRYLTPTRFSPEWNPKEDWEDGRKFEFNNFFSRIDYLNENRIITR